MSVFSMPGFIGFASFLILAAFGCYGKSYRTFCMWAAGPKPL